MINPLSAQRSPARLGATVGTRRLTSRPVIIVCAAAAGITACVLWAGAHLNQGATKTPEQEHGSNATPAEELRGPQGVMVERPTPAQPPGPAVAPSASPAPAETAGDKRRAAYLAAMQASAGVEGSDFAKYAAKPRPSMPPQQVAMLEKQDPNNAFDAQQVYRGYGPPSLPSGNAQDPNSLASYAGEANRWALNSSVQTPSSPFVIQPGWQIQATMQTGINSDLPGMLLARVSADVFDTPTGAHLLIPAGSMLVGEYGNKVIYGANRLFVAWQRINFPDGTWLDIGAMPGTDASGTSGLHDLTDAHFLSTFGHAMLMSVITAGVTLSQPNYGNNASGISASQALSQALGANLGTAMSELFSKDINRSPTLKIRPGYNCSLFVTKDLYFPHEYHRPDYTVH